MANRLPTETRVQILNMLCEGVSMRAISRMTGVSTNTVDKLLVDAGLACVTHHEKAVRGVKAKRVQCDEIWSFVYAKAKNVKSAKAAPKGAGDVWTWTAIDSDSKLLISYLVGGRDAQCAWAFMDDVKFRLANRVQLSTDGWGPYLQAVDETFGTEIDYAQLVKLYGEAPGAGRYSPAECIGIQKRRIVGKPDMREVSTSYVERSNLSMRMHNRRFTRLTNAHSKKFQNHCHMIALYTTWYNFVRINSAVKMAPAMAAGISDKLWEMTDIVALIDAAEPAPKPRGPYNKTAQISK
ncbi:MAG: helix-turn-helix domain-containing protein [Rhodospirillaceae bacterium]|nr:helix-turn-helix domain-containing protein [Rhodospirillaceae bacterium]